MLLPFSVKTTIKISILMIMLPHEHGVDWFIRNFKKYTGSTPMQLIVGNAYQQCSDVT